MRGLPDESCLAKILRDEIDILVDLAGHTAGNRLALLGAKAAPIQATYLGYYGTTGLPQVDYWITDPVLHPPDRDAEDPCTEALEAESLLCELQATSQCTGCTTATL